MNTRTMKGATKAQTSTASTTQADLINALEGAIKGGDAVQTIVLHALEHEPTAITGAAQHITDTYPDDRAARNARLSVLRVQLRRACAALQRPAVTIKNTAAAGWTLVDAQRRPAETLQAAQQARVVSYIAAHWDDPDMIERLKPILEAHGWHHQSPGLIARVVGAVVQTSGASNGGRAH